MPKPLKLPITYNYGEEPILKLLCARMLEDAFRRREDVEVFHAGEIEPADADVVFNTLPLGNAVSGRLTRPGTSSGAGGDSRTVSAGDAAASVTRTTRSCRAAFSRGLPGRPAGTAP